MMDSCRAGVMSIANPHIHGWTLNDVLNPLGSKPVLGQDVEVTVRFDEPDFDLTGLPSLSASRDEVTKLFRKFRQGAS